MNKFNKVITVIICFIVLGFSISFLILEKKDFSEDEFRYLEKWPKFSFDNLLNGKYIKQIENYTTDHFLLRNDLVGLKTATKLMLNERLINDVYVGSDSYLIQKYIEDTKYIDKIINNLNSFKKKNQDINMSFMLVPTSVLIENNKLPIDALNDSEESTIEYFSNNLDFDVIDVSDILKSNKDKYQLYYRTDHHWTSYGAYFAYLKYCDYLNIKNNIINDYDKIEVSNDFLGTLYSKTFIKDVLKDTIYRFELKDKDNISIKYLDKSTDTLYDDTYLDSKDKYSYFLGGNKPLIEITNLSSNNSNNLLVIKDSYANAFIPFLVNHYKKIYVIDPRYYNVSISNFIIDNDIKNVLFLYNVLTINNDTGIVSIR